MKKYILSSIVALSLGSLITSDAAKVIAHRGYWNAPGSAQNSIRSLVKADSIGCYASEFDVWFTADSVLIVNHDNDYKGHHIESSPSELLLKQKLSNGEYLPTLDQFLDTAVNLNVKLIFELKPHINPEHEREAVRQSVKMIEEKGLTDRTEYITFSQNAMDEFIKVSNRPVYYLTGNLTPSELKERGASVPDYNYTVYKKNPELINQSKHLGMLVK